MDTKNDGILSQLLNGINEDGEEQKAETSTATCAVLEKELDEATEGDDDVIDAVAEEEDFSDFDGVEVEVDSENDVIVDDVEEKAVKSITLDGSVTVEESDDEVKEEVIKKKSKKPEKPLLPSWSIRLSDIPKGKTLRVNEFSGKQIYQYQELLTPDDEQTGMFMCFCQDDRIKKDGKTPWVPMKGGTLSDRYVVVQAEELIKSILDEVDEDKTNKQHTICHEPYLLEYGIKTNHKIELFNDETAKIIFNMITGLDDKDYQDLRSTIHVVIVNSYDGKKSLRLDFVVKTSAKVGDSEYNLIDYFTLGNNSHILEHMSNSVKSVSAKFESIKNSVDGNVAILKEHKSSIDSIIVDIASRFKKANREAFITLCDNLPNDDKNLFFVMIMASIVLTKNYSLQERMKIRTYIDSLLSTIF